MRTTTLLALVSASSVLWVSCSSCSSCDERSGDGAATEESPAAAPVTMTVGSFRLSNGLEVELLSGPCGDEIAVAALFAVGADHDPPGGSGMTHVLERAVRASMDDEERFDVGRDHALYSVVGARGEIPRTLQRLAARISEPELTEEAFARAKSEVLAELDDRRGGDAELTALSFAAESVRPSAGDGFRAGIASEVEAIDRASAEAFWRAHFGASNARVVVGGRFEPAAVRAHVERAFSPLPVSQTPTPRDPVEASVSGTLVMGASPTAVALAVRVPAPSDPLYAAFAIHTARLMSQIEGRAWQARYDPMGEPGVLFVSGSVVPGERPEAAADALRREMRAVISRPLAPGDLAAAKARFGLAFGIGALDPDVCAGDPRAFVATHARRRQLGVGDLGQALDAVTDDQLAEARAAFDRAPAVLGGGEIR